VTQAKNLWQFVFKMFNPRVNATLYNKNISNILVTFEVSTFLLFFGGVSPRPTLQNFEAFFFFLCGKVCEKFPENLVNF